MGGAKRFAGFAALAMIACPAIAQQVPSSAPPPDPYATINAILPADAVAAVGGINAFSVDLYKRMAGAGGNLFLSPAGVSTAMALAYRGAKGRTADELRDVLHYDAAPDAYFSASGAIFATMNFAGQSRVLQTANSIWVQDGMPLHADYLADVQTHMKAGLQRTDFKADPEKSRAEVNAWVAVATHDRIRELLAPVS